MENLVKDGKGVTDVGYYKELLFRKVDRGSDVSVRATSFSGAKFGKVVVVGVEEFAIKESDGEITKIKFNDILDVQ